MGQKKRQRHVHIVTLTLDLDTVTSPDGTNRQTERNAQCGLLMVGRVIN